MKCRYYNNIEEEDCNTNSYFLNLDFIATIWTDLTNNLFPKEKGNNRNQ
jgi:hypothetical protein